MSYDLLCHVSIYQIQSLSKSEMLHTQSHSDNAVKLCEISNMYNQMEILRTHTHTSFPRNRKIYIYLHPPQIQIIFLHMILAETDRGKKS